MNQNKRGLQAETVTTGNESIPNGTIRTLLPLNQRNYSQNASMSKT